MNYEILGRYLITAGSIILFLGLFLLAADKLMMGKLFGDIQIKSGDSTFIIPIATIVLISITVTLIVNFIKS